MEPGRNGVGDYVRRLAGQVIREGHQASVIALFDVHLSKEATTMQDSENTKVKVLRIPSTWSVQKRINRANKWIDEFKPDWLSLQFVPFSFHPKGLPFGLGQQLAGLCRGRHWHIMFHELWVGTEPGSNWKRTIYIILQKYLIKQLINSLRPTVIHTHLPVYRSQLEKIGFKVKNLPLFSNIKAFSTVDRYQEDNYLRIGIFSQIEVTQNVTNFISDLISSVENYGLPIEVLLIGGDEIKMKTFGTIVDNLNGFEGQIKYTGFLKPSEISLAIQSCTIGLTSVPRHGLGKSGSVAAFLSHGVPVAAPNVLPNYDSEEIGFFSDELKSAIILTPTIDNVYCAKKAALAVKGSIELASIANTYLSDLINL